MPEDMRTRTLTPAVRAMSPVELSLRKILFRSRQPIDFALCGAGATLLPFGEPAVPVSGICVQLTVAGEVAELILPEELVSWLVRAVDPSVSVGGLDADVFGMLLELSLLDLLGPLEAKLGIPIRLFAVASRPEERSAQPDQGELAWAAELRLDRQHYPCVVFLKPRAARLLATSMAQPSLGAARFGVPIAIGAEIGRAWVRAADLRTMTRDDVILPPEPLLPPDRVRLTLADRWQAKAARTDNTLQLLAAFEPFPIPEVEAFMTEGREMRDIEIPLDDLPVRLVFEAGRIELSFDQLGQLGPGQVLVLPNEPSAPIRILVQGRVIGSGELVRIGERVGIRVVELAVQGPIYHG